MSKIIFESSQVQGPFVSEIEQGLSQLEEAIQILDQSKVPSSFSYRTLLSVYVNELKYSSRDLKKLIDWSSTSTQYFNTLEDSILQELNLLEIPKVNDNGLKVKPN